MTIIGDLFVAVRPETAGFNSELDSKLKAITSSASGALGPLSAVGAGIVGGFVAASVVSIKLASDFQGTVASIAANADIPISAAKKIGAAFLSTAGTTIFSAIELGGAYAAVAGQLGLMNGKALSAKQALDFMKISSDLAEGSGSSLASTTKTLAAVMQAFQIPVKDAGHAADQLFNISRVTGVGLDSLGSTVDRLHARLGVAAPSLTDMGTLLVDLQEHGVTGARGLLVVNTALTTLLKSAAGTPEAVAKTVNTATTAATTAATALQKAQNSLADVQQRLGNTGPTVAQQQALANAQDAVTQAQQRLAASSAPTLAQQQALANAQRNLTELQQRQAASTGLSVSQQITLTNAQNAVAAATAKHSAAVQALAQAQDGLSPKLSASVAGAESLGLHIFNAAGKFEGLGSVIAQLQPKLKGMTEQQQLNALGAVFGTSANKALLETVLAGPAAYDKAREAVTRAGTAHEAAEKQAGTLKHQMQLLKATASDLGVEWGQKLIPIIDDVGKVLARVTEFFAHNKAAAIALASVVGSVAIVSVTAFAITLKDKLVGALVKVGSQFGLFGKDAVKGVSEATGAYQDAAGRWHEAGGKFISASDAVKLQLGEQVSAVEELDQALGQLANSLIEVTSHMDPLTGGIDGLVSVEDLAKWTTGALAESNLALSEAYAAVDEAQATLTASMAEVDAALAETGLGFEGLAATVEASSEGMAEVAETTGPAIDAGLGPIGIAIAAIGFLLPLLLQHWKQIWGAIKDAVHVVVAAIQADMKFVERIFDDVIGFAKDHWKLILGILLAPILPVLAVWLLFPKQIKKILDDAIGFFKRFPHDVEAVANSFGTLLIKGGKMLIHGLVIGLEDIADVYKFFYVTVPLKLLGLADKAGTWLLHVGGRIIDGLVKGIEEGAELPVKAVEKVGKKLLGGISSVLSIFSPSKATELHGRYLIDGLVLGIQNGAADNSRFTAPFTRIRDTIFACLADLASGAKKAGVVVGQQLALGLDQGMAVAAKALANLQAGASPGAAGAGSSAAAGISAVVLKQLLEVTTMSSTLLRSILAVGNGQEMVAANATVVTRTALTELITLSKASDTRLADLMARDTAVMLAALNSWASVDKTLGMAMLNREVSEADSLQQMLAVDRLNLVEQRVHTSLLRQLLTQAQKPQTLTVAPSSTTAPPGASGASTARLASAIL